MHGEGRVPAGPPSPSPCQEGTSPICGLAPVLAKGPRDILGMWHAWSQAGCPARSALGLPVPHRVLPAACPAVGRKAPATPSPVAPKPS